MCGINGFNFADEKLIASMNEAVRHRGPDASGVFVYDKISLGHRRLSILDLSASANQPMFGEDGNLAIVFNGEIYNFLDLKKELGGKFKTTSDTEVILRAYEKWGAECVKKFNGIFAFAIWDKNKRELFLARDPLGVKPLYYFLEGGRLVFSSEIKAILEHPIPRTLDQESLNHYLRVLYVPEPLTMFKNIKKFPPAHYAFWRNSKLELTSYWRPREVAVQKNLTNAVYDGLLSAVKRQLISDRPVGLYLSGGIDSSAILHCMSDLGGRVKTFTVGFELSKAEQKDKFNQDFDLAKRTAGYYKSEHHEVLVSETDILDILPRAIWHLDEPISNPTVIPMFKLAELTKQDVAVALGGDGGDELFGGYERYRLSSVMSVYQKIVPARLRILLEKLDGRFKKINEPAGIDRFALFHFIKDTLVNRFLADSFNQPWITKRFFAQKFFSVTDFDFEKLFMTADRRSWLVDESLARTDKMSMAFGLEARVPFLDLELVDLAHSLSTREKVSPFNQKIILKKAFADKLPKYLFQQTKRGFFSPGAKWLRRKKILEMAKDVLSPEYYSETAAIFSWPEVRNMLDKHVLSQEYNFVPLWAILTFQIWAKVFKIKL
ncbi:asparagine synthase (glutamine-hydrolyzing) [Candidatus Wolfebacteria bacterium]|nr:asparagine synthase (glutamine-hydrolyzing) [Candidatus Wolfebacteria bacterium]